MIEFHHPLGVRFYNIPYDEPNRSSYTNGGVSRDWQLPAIPCAVSACPCNKNAKCEMPSRIEIGPDGACKFGVVSMEYAKKHKKKP